MVVVVAVVGFGARLQRRKPRAAFAFVPAIPPAAQQQQRSGLAGGDKPQHSAQQQVKKNRVAARALSKRQDWTGRGENKRERASRGDCVLCVRRTTGAAASSKCACACTSSSSTLRERRDAHDDRARAKRGAKRAAAPRPGRRLGADDVGEQLVVEAWLLFCFFGVVLLC